MQVGEASLCPSSGGCSQHVREPSRSGSETGLGAASGRQIRGQEPDGTRPYLMFRLRPLRLVRHPCPLCHSVAPGLPGLL